jgi:DNA polymerase elongation subunit (family B)
MRVIIETVTVLMREPIRITFESINHQLKQILHIDNSCLFANVNV